MHIDEPRREDIPALRHLWQEAFGDDEDFIDGFFATGFREGCCRCLKTGDRVAAALYWFDCGLGEKKLAYIYAVATDKAYRGRGLCRSLTEDTHRHLRDLGYDGWLLVPANEKLFTMYEKMGYRPFCPMQWVTVAAHGAIPLRPVTEARFQEKRRSLLPPGGILQEGPSIGYLATFCAFYEGEGCLLTVTRQGKTLQVQEYLGDRDLLGGAIGALGAENALVHLPGGEPYAMYFGEMADLSGCYFGLSMG